MSMTQKYWSVSALSVEFGIDRRTVAKRLAGIAPVKKDGRSQSWLLADVAPALLGVAGGEGDETGFDEARRRKAVAEARLAEFAADLQAGRVLPRDDVDAAVVAAFARVRTRLLSVPTKCAPLVHGKSSAEAAETIRLAIWGALGELSETVISDFAK